MNTIQIIIYKTYSNKEPYSIWEAKLDIMTRALINNRLDRMSLGNFGDAKLLKATGGIWELRINWGPGYRIYFGKSAKTIVVLLIGGDKKSQESDIQKAKSYWLDYKEQK